MDKEFEEELLLSIKNQNIDCAFLNEVESIILLNRISQKFGLNFSNPFLWENNRVIFINSYDNKWDLRWDLLMSSISELDDTVFIVITEDSTFPFPIIKIKKLDLVRLLDDSRIFEYFIIDINLNFIVFDTHHSEILKLPPHL